MSSTATSSTRGAGASRPDVVLLRSGDSPDRYVEAFAEAGLQAVCEPVLAFAFPNQAELSERLADPARYGGIIATSPRAVRALSRAFKARPDLQEPWTSKRAFAVGPKTAGSLRELSMEPLGENAGSADALVDEIVRAVGSEAAPLLFLAGNRRRDVLPRGLSQAGVSYEEVTAYETLTRSDIAISDRARWLAFFSPSGIEAVLEADGVSPEKFRRAAIGPTTGGALAEADLPPQAVADNPSPEALVAAIVAADQTPGDRD